MTKDTYTVALDDAGTVRLDPMRLIATRALACTNSGGGKSRLIRRIVEQVLKLAIYPVIILDREGEFGTLREKFDVVLVGEGGEVPCTVETATKLARRLIELRVSAVIDLSGLAMQDKRRFVRLFCEALIALPRSLWEPTLIVIDEAHQFAPESGREAESLSAVVSLMDQGRKRGFGAILATQRLAKLHKDAAAEANNLFMGRCAQDVDIKRAVEYLGASGRDTATTIRSSLPGEFFALGPALAIDGVARFRSGAVVTTHPDPQDRRTIKPPQPSKRILAVAGELAELQREVVAERDEITELRRKTAEQATEIVKLKRGTSGSISVGPSKAEIEQMCADAREQGYVRGRAAAIERMQDHLGTLADSARKVVRASHPPAARTISAATSVVRTRSGTVDSRLGAGGERKMLTALAQHPDGLDRNALGLLAGLSPSGGTFAKYLSNLKGRGWIDAGALVTATSEGIAALGSFEPLPTGRALVDYWLGWVGQGGQRRMLEAIVGAGKSGITRNELGSVTGIEPSGGTFAKYLSQLRTANLVESGRGDRLVAAVTLLESA